MAEIDALREAVVKGDREAAVAHAQRSLDSGRRAAEIVDRGLIAAMNQVGESYSKGLLFVPQMLRSARTMQECMNLIKPFLKEGEVVTKGKVVIGTVKGDLHDIGKNMVSMMLEGAGFSITDLGVDVPAERFVLKVQEIRADILGMSALLSTTMRAMPDTIRALGEAGIREGVKVMVGGAPVTQAFAEKIGADAYAPEAGSAVQIARKLLRVS
jgi:5-methyltetrahydrofolate--homocysteine methyltransferase